MFGAKGSYSIRPPAPPFKRPDLPPHMSSLRHAMMLWVARVDTQREDTVLTFFGLPLTGIWPAPGVLDVYYDATRDCLLRVVRGESRIPKARRNA